MADTEIPVIMRFLAETQDVQNGVNEVEESTEEALEHLQDLADVASKVAQDAVNAVKSSYEGLKKEIQAIAAGAAALGTATAVGITSFGKSAVEAAANFQDLRTRLRGLTGDTREANQAFEEAVQFAARTPFSVESIVAATAQLEAFGVGGKENLELVANIAAATGGKLEDVSLRVAKALSGSSEGFQALRDTAGITGEKLAKFGANLSTASLVSVKTAEDVQKATTALKELGKAEFAGSIDRQAEDFSGAISNAKDAITNFKAVIGDALLPTIVTLSKAFAAGVNAATELIRPFAGLVATMGAMTAAAAAGAAALAGLVIPFAGLIAKVILVRKAYSLATTALATMPQLFPSVIAKVTEFSSAIGASSLQVSLFSGVSNKLSSTVIPGLLAKMTALRSGAAALLAHPLAPIFLATAAAAGLATFAINRYADAQKELGDQITKAAANSAQANTQYRRLTEIIEKASGQDFSFSFDVQADAAELKSAFEGIDPLRLASELEAAGLSLEDLNAALQNHKDALGAARQARFALQEAENQASDGYVRLSNLSKESAETLREVFGDVYSVSIERVNEALGDAINRHQRLIQIGSRLGLITEEVKKIPDGLAAAAKEAEALSHFLSFAGRLEGVDQLNRALGIANTELRGIEANLLTAVGTLDRFSLTKKLGDSGLSKSVTDTIQKYLSLLDAKANLEDKIADRTAEAKKKELQAYELVTERRKSLGDLSLEQERTRIQAELKMVEAGTAEEVSILKRLADVDEQIRRDRAKKATDIIQDQIDSVNDTLSGAKVDTGNAYDLSKVIRENIAAMQAFEKAHKEAFANAPEAVEKFRNRLADLQNQLKQTEARGLVENFQKLKAVLEQGLGSSTNTGQEIERTAFAIENLKKAIGAGLVDQAKGEEYIASLEQKKLDLVRQQTDEKLKQANEIAQLEIRAAEDEIKILEARKAAGENVDRQLEASRQKRLELELAAIEAEKEASIKAGGDKELAQRKADLRRNKALQDETLRKYTENAQNRTQTGQLLQAAQSFRNNIAPPALSQPGSPYAAPPGSGNGLFSGPVPSFLPDFAANFGVSRFKNAAPPAPKFEQIQRKIEQDQAQKAAAKDSKADKVTNITYKTNINIDDKAADIYEQKLKRAAEALMNRNRQKKLRGPGTGPIEYQP